MDDAQPQLTPEPGETTRPPPSAAAVAEERSLFDDVRDIVDDGRTLIEAELAYQSARVAFVWERGASITLLLLAAGVATALALIVLTVGLLLALTPILTIWGSLAVVTGLLLFVAWMALRMAKRRFVLVRAKLISGPQKPPSPDRLNA